MMNCSHADNSTDTHALRKRLRRLEICLFLGIVGTLFLVISNSMTISSISIRIQDNEDKVFPSLQKMDDDLKLLSGFQKDQRSDIDNLFEIFENMNIVDFF